MLQEVRTEGEWDRNESFITFDESSLRTGLQQQAECIFSTGDERSSIILSFNPRQRYEGSCCEYRVNVKDSLHAYHVDSFIRVLSNQAVVVVNVEAH